LDERRTVQNVEGQIVAGITKFNAENCDPLTQIIFADWATVPMIRAYKFLRDSSDVMYRFKAIAEFLDVSIGTAHNAITTLKNKGYIVENNGVYSIKVGKIQKTENFQKTEKVIQNSENSIQKTENNFQKTERTNNTLNNNILNNKREAHSPESKFFELSKKSLDYSAEHESDNRHILLGRRPMKKYPEIWLTEHELSSILEMYESEGIPIDSQKRYAKAFISVNSKLQMKKAKGERLEFTNPYDWLIGFAKLDLLRELSASASLKRNELYLENSK